MPDSEPRRPPCVLLGIPSFDLVHQPMMEDTVRLAVCSTVAGIFVDPKCATGAYPETNRNNIVRSTLNHPFPVDAILWFDADMRFPPDMLVRLWKHEKDIAGAIYRERQEPYCYLGKFLDDDDQHATEGGLHKMELLSGSMLLVKLDVYRKLPPPWYVDDGSWRDDYYFSRLARQAGYDLWCDMDLTKEIRHRGFQEIGWFQEGERIARRKEDSVRNILGNPSLVDRAGPDGRLFSAPERVA